MSTRTPLAAAGILAMLSTPNAGAIARGAADVLQSSSPSVRTYLKDQLEPSGIWWRDNPAFKPGAGEPRGWERVLRLGPNPDVVTADAMAVMENGDCQFIAHFVYWWDAAAGRVAVDSFAAGGVRGAGGLVHVDGAWVVESEITLPDGSTIRFRDLPLDRPAGEHGTRGARWTGSAWQAADAVVWVRRTNASCPVR
jgi:hypothetical protein